MSKLLADRTPRKQDTDRNFLVGLVLVLFAEMSHPGTVSWAGSVSETERCPLKDGYAWSGIERMVLNAIEGCCKAVFSVTLRRGCEAVGEI